ncbi:hypothetical protein J2X57_000081 [Luteibacter sp. 1214]|uniref:DUF6988 family protein n=1 Tax=Luteibacter sp. 1214 TaxID=2817735 RepID=UPI00285F03E9|nr:hypothetical protein [Luteibacter sp. 1214]MDR6640887.1 hypothetical protein [Luteibacter sp. 1214]
MDDDHKFMVAQADAAREHIEAIPRAMAALRLEAATPRVRIVAQLARASIDFGRGAAILMAEGFMDLGAPAISLHRMQMEQVLRSAFFSGPATEEEVNYFVKNDKLRHRPRESGQKHAMTVNELTAIVEPYLDQDEPFNGKLGRVVKNSYGTLSALVHGGHALLNAYGGGSDQVGFDIPRDAACQVLDHVVAFANFALAIVARSANDGPEALSEILEAPFRSFTTWTERREMRKAAG